MDALKSAVANHLISCNLNKMLQLVYLGCFQQTRELMAVVSELGKIVFKLVKATSKVAH